MSVARTLRLIRETNHLLTNRELDDNGEYDRAERLQREGEREEIEIARACVRLEAAMLLSRDIDTCISILRRLPVRAGNLDGVILKRALRGGPLPSANVWSPITDEMLDAIVEAGPVERR